MSDRDSILNRLGIQPRPYRSLVRSLLLMDFRSQHYTRSTGARPGDLIPPFYWVVGQHLFISCILALVLFARVDVGAYAFVNLTASMLLMLNAILVEFNEVVLDVEDLDLIGHRPITQRTFAAARLTNLGFYVGTLTLALNIFPAIVGLGLRDSGFWYLPAYLLACVLGNLIIVALAIILYSLSPPERNRKDYRDLLAWTQILLAFCVFIGAQMMLRDRAHRVEMFFADPPGWLAWVPSAGLATFVEGATHGPTLRTLGWAVAATVVTGLVCLLALLRLVSYYARAQPAGDPVAPARATGRPRPFVGPLVRRVARSRPQAATLALCLRMLVRDHDLRMRTLPVLTMVVAAVGLGLFTEQFANPTTAAPNEAILPILAIQLVAVAIPIILYNLGFSRDHEATWAIQIAPAPPPVHAEASRLTACYAIALPVLLLLGCCFAVAWRDPASAAIHCGCGWLVVLTTSHASLWALKVGTPLARPAARGAVMGPIAPFLAAVMTTVTLLGIVQYYACRSQPLLIGYAAALFAMLVAARYLGRMRSPRRVEMVE